MEKRGGELERTRRYGLKELINKIRKIITKKGIYQPEAREGGGGVIELNKWEEMLVYF
jgi:hypothetical protein